MCASVTLFFTNVEYAYANTGLTCVALIVSATTKPRRDQSSNESFGKSNFVDFEDEILSFLSTLNGFISRKA